MSGWSRYQINEVQITATIDVITHVGNTFTTVSPVVSISVCSQMLFCTTYSHLVACYLSIVQNLEIIHITVVDNTLVLWWSHGGKWFIRYCIEVVCFLVGPLSEVSLYIYYTHCVQRLPHNSKVIICTTYVRVIFYFWSHNFQPIRSIEKCALKSRIAHWSMPMLPV